MKTKFVLLLVALIASSCATGPRRVLLKHGVSQQEVNQDNAACRVQSMMVQQSDFAYRGSFLEGAMIQQQQNQVMKDCLLSKGYVEQVQQ